MSIDIQGSPRRDGSSAPAAVDLFLSYNSRDRVAVQQVRTLLGARRVSVFYDRESLGLGLNWFEPLERALRQVHGVVVFLGPNGLGRWQRREMALALDRQTTEATFPVIPVLLPESQVEDYSGFLLQNTYADLRGKLDDPETLNAIERAVRGTAAAGELAPPPGTAAICPYRGLNAFREEDAALFFGRDRVLDEPEQGLLHKVLTCPLVAVVGASGSGKSSVVRAGLLPRLRREPPSRGTWDVVWFRPGKYPFLNLAMALEATRNPEASDAVRRDGRGGPGQGLGERRCSARTVARTGPRGPARRPVAGGGGPVRGTGHPDPGRSPAVSFTLAGGDRGGFENHGPADAPRRLLLGHLPGPPAERRRPARARQRRGDDAGRAARGYRGPGTAGRAGVRAWLGQSAARRRGRRARELAPAGVCPDGAVGAARSAAVDQCGVRGAGRVAGAIGRRANAVFAGLTGEQQAAAPRLFGRLVRLTAAGEEGADTRQRVRLDDLDEASRSAVEPFVAGRLLVTARDPGTSTTQANPDDGPAPAASDEPTTVEVAHEALIRQWERLRGWIKEDREFLLWRQRLGFQIAEWDRSGRDAGTLLRGALLKEARRFARSRRADLNDREREFLRGASRNPAAGSSGSGLLQSLPSWAASSSTAMKRH